MHLSAETNWTYKIVTVLLVLVVMFPGTCPHHCWCGTANVMIVTEFQSILCNVEQLGLVLHVSDKDSWCEWQSCCLNNCFCISYWVLKLTRKRLYVWLPKIFNFIFNFFHFFFNLFNIDLRINLNFYHDAYYFYLSKKW